MGLRPWLHLVIYSFKANEKKEKKKKKEKKHLQFGVEKKYTNMTSFELCSVMDWSLGSHGAL